MTTWLEEEKLYRKKFLEATIQQLGIMDIPNMLKKSYTYKIMESYFEVMENEAKKNGIVLDNSIENVDEMLQKYPSRNGKGAMLPTILTLGIIFQIQYYGFKNYNMYEIEEALAYAIRKKFQ